MNINLIMSLSNSRKILAMRIVGFLQDTFHEYIGDQSDWWQSHVVSQLSYGQRGQVRARGISRLGQLDLQALLRVFDRNWAEISHWCKLGNEVRTLGKAIADQRNDYSHQAAEEAEKCPRDIYRDCDNLYRFSEALNFDDKVLEQFSSLRDESLHNLFKEQFPNQLQQVSENKSDYLAAKNDPDQGDGIANKGDSVLESPQARAIGNFRIHGPSDSIHTEISSFSGKPVAATEVPWRVTGPSGLELMVHICLIDDPIENEEVGQVFCDSRCGSPQRWDEIVRRLRTGIRQREDGSLFMDLRVAQSKVDGRASRRLIPLDEAEAQVGFDLSKELYRLGATQVGVRKKVTGEEGRAKNFPCVAFMPDDILTPVAAWVATTVAPLINT